jgi:hypothetical protein
MVTKTKNAHTIMKIYYKRSYTSYTFRPLMWPSSGTYVTKNKYTEMLQNYVNQCTRKILINKMSRFKIRITVKNTDKSLILVRNK